MIPPIAIVGMAARFPGADDIDAYWRNLVDGVESVSRAESTDGSFIRAVAKVADIDLFAADYFRVPPAEATIMDPQHRVLLEVAVAALEDAGYYGRHDKTIGVFVGCGENYYLRDFVAPYERRAGLAWADPARANGTDTRVHASNDKDFLAARIAFKLGLTGPSVTVQATCATSLTAVALAGNALALGDCDIALAGGASLLMPEMDGYAYASGGIYSADGRCRPFDADASGTVPGSGAAIVVLRRADDAAADRDHRRAVIRGWAINNDGGSRAGFTAPSAAGQQAVIQAALERAQVAPDEVSYVETHGTATPIGDPVEFEALRRVFATPTRTAAPCLLGAVKSNIGHADAAAGIAGLIKAALAVERGVIPATLHFRSPNPEVSLTDSPFTVPTKTTAWTSATPRIAGVSAFGVGGNNAHLIVQEPPRPPAAETTRPRQVFVLSARTEPELQRLRSGLAGHLTRPAGFSREEFADVAFTLAVGRRQFEYRWVASGSDPEELRAALVTPGGPVRPALRWTLSLHGSPRELAAMGRRLAAEEPLVRAALTEFGDVAGTDPDDDVQVAASAALSVVRVLTELGPGFARIDAPRWARPMLEWFTGGADPALLPGRRPAWIPDDDLGDARTGPGRLLVGPRFDLGAALGAAWSQGADVDWPLYFRHERRGRVPLPSYPFSRRRYWLPRVSTEESRTTPPADSAPLPTPAVTDLIPTVEKVWQEVLGLDAIDHDADFINDLAGDSMFAVEIGAKLREILQVDVPLDLPYVAPTVSSAARYIESVLAHEPPGRSVAD